MTHTTRSCFVLVLAGLILAGPCLSSNAQDARRPKKLIATGWDQADSQSLPGLVTAMEKSPFDGVVVQVLGRDDRGKQLRLGWSFLNETWKREWFQPAVDRMRGCKFQRLTENFVLVYANPGDVDWFDDAGWREIVEHWRIAAWVAKQAGFKGILFDPEPYAQPHSQFAYAAQPERDKHTFAEYCQKARQRGREVMGAVAGEYPDLTLFCYFLNSVNGSAIGQADPRRALKASGYGLLPAMLDGWLDAAPATVKLVDGCESAYRYNSRIEYLEAANLIRGTCQEFVAPENRAKYRAQVQASFGLYLDAYVNAKNSPWYIDGLGGPRAERLRTNAQTALRVADEYVWVYGEKYRWWPTDNKAVKQETWSEAIPECDHILRFARNPLDFAREEISRLQAAGRLVDLARNGDFGSDAAKTAEGTPVKYREGSPPAGWSVWQDDRSKGAFAWDRQTNHGGGQGAAHAAEVAQGCFLQSRLVKPGERYAVAAFQKQVGKGDAAIRVRWKTADGRWIHEDRDVMIFRDGPAESPAAEWSAMLGVVQVPEGVGRLELLLGASGQVSAEDAVWYDDVRLYRLP
jgi:hypothetical protein